jgi:hypothetical protein
LRRWRIGGLAAGTLAGLLMVVVACTSVTGGTAAVDAKDAPVYRTSVSVSVSESAATSTARESKRQQSLTTAAIHSSCEALSTSSVDAITAVNAYVSAINGGAAASDVNAKAGPAVDLLNHSADVVASSMTGPLSPELHDALNSWVDSARGVAQAITGHFKPEDFNSAVNRLNDAKTKALTLCDAAY